MDKEALRVALEAGQAAYAETMGRVRDELAREYAGKLTVAGAEVAAYKEAMSPVHDQEQAERANRDNIVAFVNSLPGISRPAGLEHEECIRGPIRTRDPLAQKMLLANCMWIFTPGSSDLRVPPSSYMPYAIVGRTDPTEVSKSRLSLKASTTQLLLSSIGQDRLLKRYGAGEPSLRIATVWSDDMAKLDMKVQSRLAADYDPQLMKALATKPDTEILTTANDASMRARVTYDKIGGVRIVAANMTALAIDGMAINFGTSDMSKLSDIDMVNFNVVGYLAKLAGDFGAQAELQAVFS